MVLVHARRVVVVNKRVLVIPAVHFPVIPVRPLYFQQAVRAAVEGRHPEGLFGPVVRLNGKVTERYRLVRPKVVLRAEPYLAFPHVRRVVVVSSQRRQDEPFVILEHRLYEVLFRLHFHGIKVAVAGVDRRLTKRRERAEIVRYLVQRELAVLEPGRVAVAAFVHPEEDASRRIVLESRVDIDQIGVPVIVDVGGYFAVPELAVFLKRRRLISVRARSAERRPRRLLVNGAVHYPPAARLREVRP